MKPSAPGVELLTRCLRGSNLGRFSKEHREEDPTRRVLCGGRRRSKLPNISNLGMGHGLVTRMLLLQHGDQEDRLADGSRIISLVDRIKALPLLSRCKTTCLTQVFLDRANPRSRIPSRTAINRLSITHFGAQTFSRMLNVPRSIAFFRPHSKTVMVARHP